ncbi:MAG: SPFH domain-containing protein [Lachnospiraceae bacterium]|nr:SPFH domain-containing protein [Lachnospiraceae bacterium]
MELISVIKYEGSGDVIAHKAPKEDFNFGSQLIVHETQEALFLKDGKALNIFPAGRHTLETLNFPFLKDLIAKGTGGENIFHAEVYFINKATQMGLKWGTDTKVRLFDPASGMNIEIGASGDFNLRVVDSYTLITKLVGTTDGLVAGEVAGDGISYGNGKFKALVSNKVKSNLARVIKDQNINILEIDSYLDQISEVFRNEINVSLEEYGLTMPEFYVTSISTPDDDPNFIKLRQQYADKTLKVREEEVKKAEAEAAMGRKLVEAQTEAQMKMVSAQGEAEALKIKAQAEADAYKMQAAAEAEEMKMKGYTYQQETAREVGLEAMKNGITGGGTAGGGTGIGDIAGLGVTLGAMGGVINMTKDALNPMMGSASQVGEGFGQVIGGAAPEGTWNCPDCGKTGITSRFCPDCGKQRV